MSTLHQIGHAIRIGFGLSLVAALALVNGCASGDIDDESEQLAAPSPGEATENLATAPPPGNYSCYTSGGLILGTLVINPGGLCHIVQPELFGSSRQFCPGTPPFQICQDCIAVVNQTGCGLTP